MEGCVDRSGQFTRMALKSQVTHIDTILFYVIGEFGKVSIGTRNGMKIIFLVFGSFKRGMESPFFARNLTV